MQLNESITTSIEDIYLKLQDKTFLTDESSIVPRLAYLLEQAMPREDEYGIAFSGGVDSSTLALLSKKLNKKFTLYTVGLDQSSDILAATEAASLMNWTLKCKILTLEEAESVIHKVVQILDEYEAVNVVNVGVGAVEYTVLEMAKQDNQNLIVGGLGSEEIFAGYERHKENTHKACWDGLIDLYPRDLIRDIALFSHFNIKSFCPFLDEKVIEFAMQIHPELKINAQEKKIILRKAATHLGLPAKIALRKKKAAQYGSSFDKALDKLARKAGFKYKKDYLESLTS